MLQDMLTETFQRKENMCPLISSLFIKIFPVFQNKETVVHLII